MEKMTLKTALWRHVRQLVRRYIDQNGICPHGHLSRKQFRAAVEPISEAIGAKPSAVANWHWSGRLPRGEVRLLLMCYLDKEGYRLVELDCLSSEVREILESIYLGFVSLDFAGRKLGFSRRRDFMRALRGEVVLGEERRQRFVRLSDAVGIVRNMIAENQLLLIEAYLDGYPVGDVSIQGVATRQEIDADVRQEQKEEAEKDRKREKNRERKRRRRQEKQARRRAKKKASPVDEKK